MIRLTTIKRCGAVLLAAGSLAWPVRADAPAAAIDFGRDIRPILSDNCYACHGPDQDKRKAGLRLDLKEDAFKKLESGDFAFVPGKPEQSKALQLVSLPLDDDDHMPPRKSGKKLTSAQVDLLRRWIEAGAPWSEHWAFVTPKRPAIPDVKEKSWPRNAIDRFILARLEKEGLKPNAEADRYTLIRRLSLDLTGLPPTIADVDEFVRDNRPDAYERLVDRLLASPHFGERMALAWLDQARYADTAGYHFDGFRQMHLWRDWVIDAFNQNKRFDEFTVEQLAGDLLPNATREQRVASGFHRNVMTTDEGGVDPDEYLNKYAVDRVTTTSAVWLGLTVGCAECHDHKYDPISQKEFYQFYAFFNSVPEMGLDRTRTENPVPRIPVPTATQAIDFVEREFAMRDAERRFKDLEIQLPEYKEKWERAVLASPPRPASSEGLKLRFAFDESLEAATGGAAKLGGTNEPKWVEAKLGRGIQLNGESHLSFKPGLALGRTNAFSVATWVKLLNGTGALLNQFAPAEAQRGFELTARDAKFEFRLAHNASDNAIKVRTRDAFPQKAWMHVAATYDGAGKASGVTLYVDGRPRPLETQQDDLKGDVETEAPLRLGGRATELGLNGVLDDLRVYDRALTRGDVQDLCFAGLQAVLEKSGGKRTSEEQDELRRFHRENFADEFLRAEEALGKAREAREKSFAAIPTTMVMQEMETPREAFMLVRGDYRTKGNRVQPGVPGVLPPLPSGRAANRLALARWLVSPDHPLTARVTVNRYWTMLFGTGLVKTGNDFGSQGDRPSHPELLDWLASEFVAGSREGSGKPWDVRSMIRLLVTSATYRQSAVVSEEKLRRDPYNRWLGRGPRLRLEAELIRDNALAISGLLNRTIGGPSIKPYQPPGIWEVTDHKYEPSKGADLYRRGMYVFWKRAAHYPSFQTFDAPSRETCTVARPRTATPLQSLVVMNDPVYVEAARVLAERVLKVGGTDLKSQLAHAFRLAVARPPDAHELEVLTRTFREQRERFEHDEKAATDLLAVGESQRPKDIDTLTLAAMTGVANVLLNLNETITK